MRKLLCLWLIVLWAVVTTSAQIAVPNTLVDGTTITATPLNTNFTTIANHALDRLSGGNLTGNITADPGITIDGVDIGAQACTTCNPTFNTLTLGGSSGVLLSIPTFFQVSSTTVSALHDLAVGGSLTVAGVQVVNSSGAIPANNLSGSIADARLSANVPLLNATAAFTGTGTNSFNGTPTGNQVLQVRNTAAGTGNAAYLSVGNDADANASFLASLSSTFTTSGLMVQDSTQVGGERPGGVSLVASHASGVIRLGTAGTERGRIFSTGGFSWGDTTDPGATNFRVAGTSTYVGSVKMGSTNITDSVAVPTITTGFGSGATIAGRDYAFRITLGTTSPGSGLVTFNQTFANAPVCLGITEGGINSGPIGTVPTTTGVTISYTAGAPASITIGVQCRGF